MAIDWSERRIEPATRPLLNPGVVSVAAVVWCVMIAGAIIGVTLFPVIGVAAFFVSFMTGAAMGVLYAGRRR